MFNEPFTSISRRINKKQIICPHSNSDLVIPKRKITHTFSMSKRFSLSLYMQYGLQTIMYTTKHVMHPLYLVSLVTEDFSRRERGGRKTEYLINVVITF